jgi:hypothetical protein
VLALAFLVGIAAGPARADPSLFVGVDEDALKTRPVQAVEIARDLGMKAFRITLSWRPDQTALTATDRARLSTAVGGRAEMRVILAVYGSLAPVHPSWREQYCTYVRNVLDEFPQIKDVVIWNEPNLSYYWQPQFNFDGTSAAPVAYEALLARCWDVLHAARPSVNVIAPATSLWGNDNPRAISNVSHSPVNFIRGMGDAYRASGRDRPIFDTFGHHPHPQDASERPWKVHQDPTQISEGDLGKLVEVLRDEFVGTAQPVPGNGLSIWYLEDGYQTTIDQAKRLLYSDYENWPHTVPDYAGGEPDWPPPSADSPAPDQWTQIIDAVRLAYCQPYVGAYFNFLLWDESSLIRWQSGMLWADGTPKDSYPAFKRVIHEVDDGKVDCAHLKGGPVSPVAGQGGPGATGGPGDLAAAGGGESPGRPGGGRSGGARTPGSPSGTQRVRLRYTGTRIGTFGFVRLSARLTRAAGGKPIPGRLVVFKIAATRLTARSDRRGVARAELGLPLSPGGRYLDVRFAGDSMLRPAWARIFLTVLNSPARVWSEGFLRLPSGRRTAFHIVSRGRNVHGSFRFRSHWVRLSAARFTALGVGPGRRSAWFAGRSKRGRAFFAYVRKRRNGAPNFQLWLSGTRRNGRGRVVAGRVLIHPVDSTARPSRSRRELPSRR